MPKQIAADATVALPATPVAKSMKSRHKGGVPPENPVDRPSAQGDVTRGLHPGFGSRALRLSDYEKARLSNSQLDTGPFREWRLTGHAGPQRLSTLCGAVPMHQKSGLFVVSSRENPVSPEFAAWLRDIRAMSSATYKPRLALFDAPDKGPYSHHSRYGAIALRLKLRQQRAAQ
ncbi:MAG: hypothetical protein KA472_11290 [Pseudomonadales bacterium]|nr:hypothetical protein [Pseudomonadales bacterium]